MRWLGHFWAYQWPVGIACSALTYVWLHLCPWCRKRRCHNEFTYSNQIASRYREIFACWPCLWDGSATNLKRSASSLGQLWNGTWNPSNDGWGTWIPRNIWRPFERKVRQSILDPLRRTAGFALGVLIAAISPKTAMTCTIAVQEIIS